MYLLYALVYNLLTIGYGSLLVDSVPVMYRYDPLLAEHEGTHDGLLK